MKHTVHGALIAAVKDAAKVVSYPVRHPKSAVKHVVHAAVVVVKHL